MKNGRKKKLDEQKRLQENCPKFQSVKWLTGLARLLTDIDDQKKKAAKATKMPGGSHLTYKASFERHKSALLETRTKLEESTTKKTLKLEMAGAKQAVENAKEDISAFKCLHSKYYKDKDES